MLRHMLYADAVAGRFRFDLGAEVARVERP